MSKSTDDDDDLEAVTGYVEEGQQESSAHRIDEISDVIEHSNHDNDDTTLRADEE